MRTEEEIQYRTFPALLAGELSYEGYKHRELMVIELHHPEGSLLPRRGGWCFCMRCHRKYQPRRHENYSIPIRGVFEIHGSKVILKIPRKKVKKGHCLGCGQVLNDKGEK
jgi:hypothetical protein